MEQVLVGIVVRKQVVVRGRDEPSSGIQFRWQRRDRQIAIPLVAAVTRHRQDAAPVTANWLDARRLPSDVAFPIDPHHVLRRHVAERAGRLEFFPRGRLIHPQAGQVGRAARLQPPRAQRVGLSVRAILEQHRSVAGVFQFDGGRLLAFNRDRVGADAHRFPVPLIAILVWIRWIRVVDVEVLGVLSEDRQPPGAVLVVPDRDARQYRLAAADDVPTRRHQVHPVAQRRRRNHAMRIVGQDGSRADRARSGHHPVVRADVARVGVEIDRACGIRCHATPERSCRTASKLRGDILRLEPNARAKGVVNRQHVGRDNRRIDRGVELEARIAALEIHQLAHLRQVRCTDCPQQSHFVSQVRVQCLVTGNHDGRRPTTRRDSEHAKLDRQQCRVKLGLADVRIDATDVGLDDGLATRVIAIQLIIHVAAKLVQARAAVACQLAAAEDFRDGASCLPPPHFELEQPVLRRGVALGEEQVGFVLRVDVVDAPAVADDLDGLGEPGNLDGGRRRPLRGGLEAGGDGHGGNDDGGKCSNHDGLQVPVSP